MWATNIHSWVDPVFCPYCTTSFQPVTSVFMEIAAMTNYQHKKGYLAGDKHCLSCGADERSLRLLNPKGEHRGGVERIYYRCAECKDYLMECWINGALKTVLAS